MLHAFGVRAAGARLVVSGDRDAVRPWDTLASQLDL